MSLERGGIEVSKTGDWGGGALLPIGARAFSLQWRPSGRHSRSKQKILTLARQRRNSPASSRPVSHPALAGNPSDCLTIATVDQRLGIFLRQPASPLLNTFFGKAFRMGIQQGPPKLVHPTPIHFLGIEGDGHALN